MNGADSCRPTMTVLFRDHLLKACKQERSETGQGLVFVYMYLIVSARRSPAIDDVYVVFVLAV